MRATRPPRRGLSCLAVSLALSLSLSLSLSDSRSGLDRICKEPLLGRRGKLEDLQGGWRKTAAYAMHRYGFALHSMVRLDLVLEANDSADAQLACPGHGLLLQDCGTQKTCEAL